MMYAADPGTRAYADEVLTKAKELGVKVVRLWAFNDRPGDWMNLQDPPGVFHENVFQGLDYIVAKANTLNLRVTLCLVNNWPQYGGIDQYVAWDAQYGHSPRTASTHNEFYTDPDCMEWYQNFAKTLLNRSNTINNRIYKEDPTVFAWELANEPRAPGGTNEIDFWADQMSTYIKRVLRAKQLVTIGLEGIDDIPNEDTGTNFLRQNAIDNVDFTTVHCWPDHRSPKQTIDQAITWLENRIHQSLFILNKPCVVEEFGYPRDADQKTTQRDLFFQKVYDKVYEKKASGAIFWFLLHNDYAQHDDGYGVYYPTDASTADIIKAQIGRTPFKVLKVPSQYPSVLEAMYVAESGDIVLVYPGRYEGSFQIFDQYGGITLQGINKETSILDGGKYTPVVNCYGNDLPNRISGLTIRNGHAISTQDHQAGAGIMGLNGGIEISDCIITGNEDTYHGDQSIGGGIYCYNTTPKFVVIKNNIISNNKVQNSGGGIYIESPGAKIYNNVIQGNIGHLSGGGITCDSTCEVIGNVIINNEAHEYGGGGIYVTGDAYIANNIIANNRKTMGGTYGEAIRSGGGILCRGFFFPTIMNNVIFGNDSKHAGSTGRGGGISVMESAAPFIDNNIFSMNSADGEGDDLYSDSSYPEIQYSLIDPSSVFGATLGDGCIQEAPRFEDVINFRLKPDSPCINTGDPEITDLDDTRSDMGIWGWLDAPLTPIWDRYYHSLTGPGWQFISLPFVPIDSNPQKVFTDWVGLPIPISDTLFRFDHTLLAYVSYWDVDPVSFGTATTIDGYWLYLDSGVTKNLAYYGLYPNDSQEFYFPTAGWYLIGGPTVKTCLDQIIVRDNQGNEYNWQDAVNQSLIQQPLYGWNPTSLYYFDVGLSEIPGLYSTDSLEPWNAYWVLVPRSDVTMIYP
jgi:mannan endo-1,4-beta-mannosidase